MLFFASRRKARDRCFGAGCGGGGYGGEDRLYNRLALDFGQAMFGRDLFCNLNGCCECSPLMVRREVSPDGIPSVIWRPSEPGLNPDDFHSAIVAYRRSCSVGPFGAFLVDRRRDIQRCLVIWCSKVSPAN